MKKKSSIFLLILSIIFLLQGCERNEKERALPLTSEEETWLSDFFKDVFLEESAIYTLWGTKPLTAFDICFYTEEELEELRRQYSNDEEEAGEVIPVARYTIPENWSKWEQINARFPLHRFLFFKKQDSLFPKIYRLYFVNKNAVEATLKEYYKLFEERVGIQFNPREIVSEIENSESYFWQRVFDSSELIGILYGFGQKNAQKFPSLIQGGSKVRFSDHRKIIGAAELSHFTLPVFASFSEKDEMIEKYEKERERIREIYKNKNFVRTTLEKMMEK